MNNNYGCHSLCTTIYKQPWTRLDASSAQVANPYYQATVKYARQGSALHARCVTCALFEKSVFCGICLEFCAFKCRSEVCGHSFCYRCLSKWSIWEKRFAPFWVEFLPSCPLCRQKYHFICIEVDKMPVPFFDYLLNKTVDVLPSTHRAIMVENFGASQLDDISFVNSYSCHKSLVRPIVVADPAPLANTSSFDFSAVGVYLDRAIASPAASTSAAAISSAVASFAEAIAAGPSTVTTPSLSFDFVCGDEADVENDEFDIVRVETNDFSNNDQPSIEVMANENAFINHILAPNNDEVANELAPNDNPDDVAAENFDGLLPQYVAEYNRLHEQYPEADVLFAYFF